MPMIFLKIVELPGKLAGGLVENCYRQSGLGLINFLFFSSFWPPSFDETPQLEYGLESKSSGSGRGSAGSEDPEISRKRASL